MNKNKIINICKGSTAETYYGRTVIQHNREGKKISEKGYCITNVSSANLSRYRVSYIEDNKYHTTGMISPTKAEKFIKVKFGDKRSRLHRQLKKLNININLLLKNLSTNGFSGNNIINRINNNYKIPRSLINNMIIADRRHSLTDYDNVNKKNLTDYQVRELRRSANITCSV